MQAGFDCSGRDIERLGDLIDFQALLMDQAQHITLGFWKVGDKITQHTMLFGALGSQIRAQASAVDQPGRNVLLIILPFGTAGWLKWLLAAATDTAQLIKSLVGGNTEQPAARRTASISLGGLCPEA